MPSTRHQSLTGTLCPTLITSCLLLLVALSTCSTTAASASMDYSLPREDIAPSTSMAASPTCGTFINGSLPGAILVHLTSSSTSSSSSASASASVAETGPGFQNCEWQVQCPTRTEFSITNFTSSSASTTPHELHALAEFFNIVVTAGPHHKPVGGDNNIGDTEGFSSSTSGETSTTMPPTTPTPSDSSPGVEVVIIRWNLTASEVSSSLSALGVNDLRVLLSFHCAALPVSNVVIDQKSSNGGSSGHGSTSSSNKKNPPMFKDVLVVTFCGIILLLCLGLVFFLVVALLRPRGGGGPKNVSFASITSGSANNNTDDGAVDDATIALMVPPLSLLASEPEGKPCTKNPLYEKSPRNYGFF